jgi:hypothetical protein
LAFALRVQRREQRFQFRIVQDAHRFASTLSR